MKQWMVETNLESRVRQSFPLMYDYFCDGDAALRRHAPPPDINPAAQVAAAETEPAAMRFDSFWRPLTPHQQSRVFSGARWLIESTTMAALAIYILQSRVLARMALYRGANCPF